MSKRKTQQHVMLTRIADISAAKAYTNFGKFARFVFAMGMHKLAQDTKSPLLSRARKLTENCRAAVDFQTLKMLGFTGSFGTRELQPDTFVSAYLLKFKQIFKAKIKENRDVSAEEKAIFLKGLTLMSKSSEIAHSGRVNLSKFAWSIGESVGKVFDEINNGASSPDEIPVSKDAIEAFYAQWRTASKNITGSTSFKVIPTIVLQEAKSNPKKAQSVLDYQEARKRLKEYLDIALRNITRKEPLEVNEAAKILKGLGFLVLPFPTKVEGFVGKVGIDSAKVTLYTDAGVQLLGGISEGSSVRMNPKYNPETLSAYYCEVKAPMGATSLRMYALKRAVMNQENKHVSVKTSAKDLKKYLSIWTRDMKSTDPLRYIPATVAMVIYETGARVGSSTDNRSETGKAQSYGILSARFKHLKMTESRLTYTYNGKSGMAQKHILLFNTDHGKLIKKNLLKVLTGKKQPEHLVWTYSNSSGEEKYFSYPLFMSYIKSTGLQKIHYIRHIKGTSIVEDLIGKTPFKPAKTLNISQAQKAAEKYMSDIITEAGVLLGHKTNKPDGSTVTAWKTTAKSYVQPSLMIDFFKSQKLKIPTWVPLKDGE